VIDVPEKLDAEQEKAVEALSKAMNGDPRARLFEQAAREGAARGGDAR
jgi:hypothetical protein